jgi:hypothetical protein
MRATRILAAALAALSFAAAALAADILDEYQKKYTKTTYMSDKEEVVRALTATGKPEALKALQYCVGVSKAALEDARKESDKLRTKYAAAQAKFDVKFKDYREQQKKLGNPDPKTFPDWPEYHELVQAQAEVEHAERAVIAEEAMVAEVLDAHGQLVLKLPPEAQKAVRDDWTKNRLGSKDWGVRAECYEMLGHTQTDWAFDMLAAALAKDGPEPDPRALVIAIDGLAGRDAAKAVPVLASRIDDVRWIVRAAVIAALEATPSKEGVDAIVKRMAKEDGRLKDDCARALTALTGQEMPSNPEMWRIWWEKNRDKWAGKPPPPDKSKGANPMADANQPPAADDRKTGFFGLTIESKRVVFVIDVSGSMNEKVGGAGPDAKATKAALAKAELKRVIGALEDGALFDVEFFSSAVHIWKPEMQAADAKTRKEAQDYVDAVEIVGGTNTYDALEAAFSIGDMGKGKKKEADPTGDARVDTIVFLSDGKPSVGRTTDPDAIRTAVRDWNKARRISISAIAFGAEKDAADPKFMKGLADDTGGKFVQK